MKRGILRWATIFGCFQLCVAHTAASQASEPTFDAVSIHATEPYTQKLLSPGHFIELGATRACAYSPNHVRCVLSLRDLLLEAYQLKRHLLFAPDWAQNDMFVFEAVMPENTSRNSARLMMQQALKERFHLTYHYEKRVIPVYTLIIDMKGCKLQEAPDEAHRKLIQSERMKRPVSLESSPGQFRAVAFPIEILMFNLASIAGLDLPAVDMTGLNGEYDVDLHWQPSEGSTDLSHSTDLNLLDAMQKQLGLRFEKKKIPINALVVDHTDQSPTAN